MYFYKILRVRETNCVFLTLFLFSKSGYFLLRELTEK